MNNKLKINISKKDDICVVKLSGIIDEDANLEMISEQSTESIHFDLEDIEMINSCGIREWTNFIRAFSDKVEVKYFNCTPEVIEQINMIVDFLGEGALVETFFAPYFCEKCDKEQRVLIKGNEVKDGKAPVKKCSACSSELDFDALEEQYFGFLNK